MSEPRPVAVIVLAAGEGTRMKSRLPKVLHGLCGRSMLGHVLATASELGPRRLIVVAGHGREQVAAETVRCAPAADVVVQDRQCGTGHAVRMVTEALGVMPGTVLVTYGDMPLLRSGTLAALTREHTAAGNAVTVLTARAGDPSGYGRIVRDERGDLAEIVEEADATPEQRAIEEINSGCYAFDGALLAGAVKRIAAGNAQGQEYLTDVVAIARGDGHPVGTVLAADAAEIQGVNDRVQLAAARRAYNSRLLEEWMRAGVTIVDPSATWIDVDVTLGQDAEVRPGTYLEGHTVIGPGARVGPGCVLRDTTVAPDATVQFAVCESAEIGSGASVGPFAFLRPGTRVGAGAHVGADVELKNEDTSVGAATMVANSGAAAGHHSAAGDSAAAAARARAAAPGRPAAAPPAEHDEPDHDEPENDEGVQGT